MNTVKTLAIDQALRLLNASNCKYFVIDEEGKTYGEIPTVTNSKKQRKYKQGLMCNYFKPFLVNVKIGDVVVIPFNDFDPRALSGAVTAYLSTNWGKQSYKSCTTNSSIEILRCA
jgi:hypothetical protein